MKDLDWGELGFAYVKTDKRYMSRWRDGAWDGGELVDDEHMTIHECAGVLHYCQAGFEGLKAYRAPDGRVVAFRPDLNAERLDQTCDALMMPRLPKGRFVEAVDRLVNANLGFVPPHGSGATLYIRPYIFGSGVVIGVAPAPEFTFRVFCTPVGPYYKGGAKSMRAVISRFDRAAPRGTGHIKAGLNYAMSLLPHEEARENGFGDCIFLDAATRTHIEEASGANVIFVTKDGKIVTPKSPSILPSVTRRSLMVVATDMLGLQVEERPVAYAEVPEFVECALCGTAAVLSPVGSLIDGDREIVFRDSADTMGPITAKLRETLVKIQTCELDGPAGWVHEIKR